MIHRNALGLQRAALVKSVGLQVKELYREGYEVDGDRKLDELNEQRQTWNDGWTDSVRAS